ARHAHGRGPPGRDARPSRPRGSGPVGRHRDDDDRGLAGPAGCRRGLRIGSPPGRFRAAHGSHRPRVGRGDTGVRAGGRPPAPPPIDQAAPWATMVTYVIFVVDAIGHAWIPGWKHSLDWAKTRDDCERVRQLLVEALRWDDL